MKAFIPLLFFTFALTPLAKIGDVCRSDGVKGTCQKVGNCKNAITVRGACPNDPDDVRCCIKRSCQQPSNSKQGMCYDKRNTPCSGGHFITGQCPGDANMQCCIKDAKPPPSTPNPASCPAVHTVPEKLLPDDVIFSRPGTKKVGQYYKSASKTLDICEVVSELFPGGQAVGIACGIGSLAADFLADKAEKCAGKNMCLKLESYTVPRCIGNSDGCCG